MQVAVHGSCVWIERGRGDDLASIPEHDPAQAPSDYETRMRGLHVIRNREVHVDCRDARHEHGY